MKSNSSIILSAVSLAIGLLAPAAFASRYEQAVLALDPSYYWHLDEAAGATQATEVAGVPGTATLSYRFAPNNAINNSKFSTSGVSGSAVLMNAVGTLGDNALATDPVTGATPGNLISFDPATSVGTGLAGSSSGYTVQFWLKPPTSRAAGDFEAFAGNADSFNYKMASGSQSFFSVPSPQTGAARLLVTDGFTNDQWNLVTMTVVRTASDTVAMNFYTNGEIKGSGSFSGLPADFGSWNSLVFAGPQSGSGALDEIAIFNYALSPQQILSEYIASIPEPGVVSLLAIGGAFLVWRRNGVAKRA